MAQYPIQYDESAHQDAQDWDGYSDEHVAQETGAMPAPVQAWHFINDDRTLNYDLRDTVVTPGLVLTTDEPIALCERGFHASINPLDALQYAPGSVVCRVEMSGDIVLDDDKLVASTRKVIAMKDAANTLHEFTCWCAEQALTREREAGREPDARSWQAIEVKRKWLRGEASDQELSAAWAAASAAAWDAARAAASAAAWAAARAAARAADWDAASAAARAAASAAARAAASAAAWAAQNAQLETMLHALLQVQS